MATYNLTLSGKAFRSFTTDGLPERLVESHSKFDPSISSADLRAIKVIQTVTDHHSDDYNLYLGPELRGRNTRYIRTIIDIPAGKTEQQKRELLQRTTQCCMDYQGKRADECEIEVRINEVDERNVMRTNVAN